MLKPIRIVAVIGPTASGKSAVGLKLAQRIDGEIISVDSMQIYRWMDIGTAKPTEEMRSAVPHHLIDILTPDQSYNAGKFSQDAAPIIHKLYKRGRPVILLGGSNLYLKALIHGIIPVPEISPSIKKDIRQLHTRQGVSGCYLRLRQLDPFSALKLHPNDISRISRALEVVLETGKSIQEFQIRHKFEHRKYDVFFIGADWPREVLYQRINQRVVAMVEDGLVEEAENLLWRGYSTNLPSLRSIGYRQAFLYLSDKISFEEMVTDIQQKSRRYAKKQITWHRKDDSIHWLKNNELTEDIHAKLHRFLDCGGQA